MQKWLRRIRGPIGMGVTWGVVWGAAGAIPRWVFGINTDLPIPLLFGVLGFISGVTFSAILVLTEGRRRFDQMSVARFAGWGALGGVLLSALFVRSDVGTVEVLAIPVTLGFAGAMCAAGSLALAKRAVGRELPDGREGAAEVDVGAHEERNRLMRG